MGTRWMEWIKDGEGSVRIYKFTITGLVISTFPLTPLLFPLPLSGNFRASAYILYGIEFFSENPQKVEGGGGEQMGRGCTNKKSFEKKNAPSGKWRSEGT